MWSEISPKILCFMFSFFAFLYVQSECLIEANTWNEIEGVKAKTNHAHTHIPVCHNMKGKFKKKHAHKPVGYMVILARFSIDKREKVNQHCPESWIIHEKRWIHEFTLLDDTQRKNHWLNSVLNCWTNELKILLYKYFYFSHLSINRILADFDVYTEDLLLAFARVC